jgi:hypothetical protein
MERLEFLIKQIFTHDQLSDLLLIGIIFVFAMSWIGVCMITKKKKS